jgi:uncharacterized membrane protein YkvA (DUF1232 family)
MKRMSKEDASGFDMSRIQSDEIIVRHGFWRKLQRTAGVIPFSKEAVAAYCCARDSNTPIHIAVFWAAWRAISGHITNEHRTRAAELLEHPSQT